MLGMCHVKVSYALSECQESDMWHLPQLSCEKLIQPALCVLKGLGVLAKIVSYSK